MTAIGSAQPNDVFFGANGNDLADRLANVFGSGDAAGQGPGGGGFAGGRGGFGGPGGPGGPGGGFGGGPFGGRGRGGNQIRGSVYQSFDTSAFDAAPFALNGQPTEKPDYFQGRYGATLGGPLVIPNIVNSPRTFFFLNYTGNHSDNPYDAYSTVPTAAERAGDLSALGTVIDPTTGKPFPGNQIPANRQDASALALLALYPLPNQDGSKLNYHTVTTTSSDLDDINVRFVHTFGAQPQRGRGGFGGGRGGGGRGGQGGGAGSSNLNVQIHYRHSDNSYVRIRSRRSAANSVLTAWDVPVGYSFTKMGLFHNLRADFNHQTAQNLNLYANNTNVAGLAGIQGASTNPFDYGVPNLSFSSIASVRDTSPSTQTNQTVSFGDTIVKSHGKSTWRFGGDYRNIRLDSRSDSNARGTFVFSGLYTGLDFADFLLGLPQQSSVLFGPGEEPFRSSSSDLFVQDDWRATDKLTVNAGLRYEYFSPVSEATNQLVTLDVSPDFTSAVPVYAGQTGPYSGQLPDSIVRPFRTGFAPRLAVAYRPQQGLVLRAGYSINYNSSVYQTIAQSLATQPPFAITNTVLAAPNQMIPLSTALTLAQPGVTANSYAVDPDYRMGKVQIWSLDVQRDLSRTVQLGVGYTGSKGSNLDLLRAPNRTADGLLNPDVAPYIYESSGADSILQSMYFRLRKRLSNGIGAGVTYTLSKSIDDASSIAGSPGNVAQNDLDLAAERGLSSFDQRHRLNGDFTYELPFGDKKKWFDSGTPAAILGNWQFNGTVQLASGLPFTARVLSNASDVSRGTNGTLRADYNGQPITVGDPTTMAFFNTAAFSVPAAGTYGNAGRNTIIGPGTEVLNLGLTKNMTFSQTKVLSVQALASNVLNTVQYMTIDTVVNSPTFGQVTAVRPMRRIQILTRLRF